MYMEDIKLFTQNEKNWKRWYKQREYTIRI